jgi:hypothetical protein
MLTHGPDRQPMALGPDNYLVCRSGVPFHGVPSRAAVDWLRAEGTEWFDAHQRGRPSAALGELHVLSLTESAQIATRALHRLVGAADDGAELWNIKEGHTASVWFVTFADGGSCVLNVGRDPLASSELAMVTERLRAMPAESVRVAGVLDGFWVDPPAAVEGGGTPPVYVAIQELIADAFEIHRIEGRYALVERFITDPLVPSRITSVRGRWTTADEADRIDAVCDEFERVGGPLGLSLTVNDGDLVWGASTPVVVAAGPLAAEAARARCADGASDAAA